MVGLRWRAARTAWDLGMGTAVGLLAGTDPMAAQLLAARVLSAD